MINFNKLLSVLAVSTVFLANVPSVGALDLVISDNAGGSTNEVNVTQTSETTVVQESTANVTTNVTTTANTGGNSASENNGDVVISTGDVSSNLAVQTAVNSSVAEVGCCQGNIQMSISGNGSGTVNTINYSGTNTTTLGVNQTANVENKVYGVANSGENKANNNSGSVKMLTGNVSVYGEINNDPINFASAKVSSGMGGVDAKISDNSEGSVNAINAELNLISENYQNSSSDIENFVVWDVNSGQNVADKNSGDVEISTGDVAFKFVVNNKANENKIIVDCCGVEVPEKPVVPTVTPTPGVGGNSGADGGPQGQILPAAAATEAGGPGIAGLSDTGSGTTNSVIFFAGLVALAFGMKLFAQEVLPALQKSVK